MRQAEIARQLGVSRAYVTMLVKGERQPSKRLSNRIKKLTGKSSLPDTFACFTRKRSEVQVPYRPPSLTIEVTGSCSSTSPSAIGIAFMSIREQFETSTAG